MKQASVARLDSEAQRIVGVLGRLSSSQLTEVEATRDLSQVIVHVDMDAFVSPYRSEY